MSTRQRLYRSETDSKLAGICGGIGEVYGLDSNMVRLGMVFAALMSGFFPLAITYVVGWIILPKGRGEES